VIPFIPAGPSPTIPTASQVQLGTAFGFGETGTLDPGSGGTIPAAADVRLGTAVGATTGTLAVPAAAQVLSGVAVDAGTGTYVIVVPANVRAGIAFGPGGSLTGTFAGGAVIGTSPSTITVNDPNGNPVEGAEVFIAYEKGTTDAAGQCVLNVVDEATNYLSIAYPNNETGRIGDAFTAVAD
jgi:hypothetical protein